MRAGLLNNRGFALILVLWVGALIGALASSFSFAHRGDLEQTLGQINQSKAEALAEAGLNRAILALMDKQSESRWLLGERYDRRLLRGRVSIFISSESSRIDLNAAAEPLIEGLMAVALEELNDPNFTVIAKKLTHEILDWRDRNQERRLHGAEDSDYQRAGRAQEARDAPFMAVSELRSLLSMQEPLYQILREQLTVNAHTAQIDPMTASRTVLRALPGISDQQVEAFLASRDGVGGTASPSEESRRQALIHLSAAKRYLLRSAPRMYRIAVLARHDDGGVAALEVSGQVSRNPRRPVTLHRWRSGLGSEAAERLESKAETDKTGTASK